MRLRNNKDRKISGFLVWDMEDPATPRPLIAPLSELAAEVIARHNAEFFSTFYPSSPTYFFLSFLFFFFASSWPATDLSSKVVGYVAVN
jgi:hypothetical protein